MFARIKRRKYLVHLSSQLKYIGVSVIPLLLLGVLCMFFMAASGDFIFTIEKDKLQASITNIEHTLGQLEREGYSQTAEIRFRVLKNGLRSLESIYQGAYYQGLQRWNETKSVMIGIIFVLVVGTLFFAIIYSHRIAGPLLRLQRSLDMLARGQDIPPIHLRSYDEFKEVAASAEKLRQALKQKGVTS